MLFGSRFSYWPPLQHRGELTLLHDLAALVQHLDGLHHDPAIGLAGLALGGDPDESVDRVAEADRPGKFPGQAEESDNAVGVEIGTVLQPIDEREAEQPVSD